jgi:hypothetical protein
VFFFPGIAIVLSSTPFYGMEKKKNIHKQQKEMAKTVFSKGESFRLLNLIKMQSNI